MDFTQITQFITNVGFPIVACYFLYKQNVKQADQHKEEMEHVTEALNKNTVAYTALAEKLDKLADKIGEDKDEK